jgi:hypothetical protein
MSGLLQLKAVDLDFGRVRALASVDLRSPAASASR